MTSYSLHSLKETPRNIWLLLQLLCASRMNRVLQNFNKTARDVRFIDLDPSS